MVNYSNSKAIVINKNDNVATALADLKKGEILDLATKGIKRKVRLKDNISFGHKLSLIKIDINSPVIKYGEVIGIATDSIETGEWIHVHNLVSVRGRGDLKGGKK